MSVVGENIRLIREANGLTQSEFASLLGVKRGRIATYETTESKPDAELANAISQKFDIKIADLFNTRLNIDNVKRVANGSKVPHAAEPSAKYTTQSDTKPVPYLRDIDAIAGTNGAAMDISEYIDEFISVPFFSKASYYVNVRGSSMFPRYTPGDIIAIKQVQDKSEIQYGAVYVVITHENRVIKYVRKGSTSKHLLLVSANAEFDPYEVEREKVVTMFLVLGKITKEVL